MATVVQGIADSGSTLTNIKVAFPTAPAVGNLLVMFYGARDDGSVGVPVFTVPTGWVKVGEASPMEFHTFGIAWWDDPDTVPSGDQQVNFDRTCNSRWMGMVEFNETGVSAWALDTDGSPFNGSGASNTSSIASGTTGTLSDSTGVAVVGGTSRTGSEDLSTDVGASLVGTDPDFEVDAGSANWLAAWLSLVATTALDATISESSGSSRMGAGLAVFVPAGGGGGQTVVVGRATEADVARPVGVANPRTYTVARATEVDVARALAVVQDQTVLLARAVETDVARAVAVVQPIVVVVGRAAETDTARPATVANPRSYLTARATEIDIARPVTVDQDQFGAPTGLTDTAKTDTTIDLAWDAVTGASGYDVERDSAVIATDVADTTFQDTGLDPSTEYTYRVRAVAA